MFSLVKTTYVSLMPAALERMAVLLRAPVGLALLLPSRDAAAKCVLDTGEGVGGQPQA